MAEANEKDRLTQKTSLIKKKTAEKGRCSRRRRTAGSFRLLLLSADTTGQAAGHSNRADDGLECNRCSASNATRRWDGKQSSGVSVVKHAILGEERESQVGLFS